jgi:Lon protease-like protein
VARIVKLLKMGEDNYSLMVQGLAWFRILELVKESPYLSTSGRPSFRIRSQPLSHNRGHQEAFWGRWTARSLERATRPQEYSLK